MASRDVNKLIEPFRTSIKELLNRANAAGIPAFVTDTTRTLAEQKELVRKGLSRTLESKHLTGEAADIAFQVDGKLSYNAALYDRLYVIAQDIHYLIWPYKDLNWNWDKPHFQYEPTKKTPMPDEVSQLKEKIKQLETFDKEERVPQIKRLQEEVHALTDKVLKEESGHKDTLEKLSATMTEREKLVGEKRLIEGKLEACQQLQSVNSESERKLQEILSILTS